jgi:hypothetical protein
MPQHAEARFTQDHLDAWRQDGGVLIERFFTPAEVAAVHADFVTVFGRSSGAAEATIRRRANEPGRFNGAQFASFEAIPFDCSPALNLIGVHPELIRFARAAMGSDHVHLYQCQAWAKFTGDADYEQPFHCDYSNHTLTVPSEDEHLNSVTILCYFTDVTEAHGPMHYVARTDSNKVAGPEAIHGNDPDLTRKLTRYERSSASPAGSIFPYTIDVFHRGTNLTAPGGYRFAVMACFKRADNDTIGYHAWPYHHTKPWHHVFNNATPDQLACFGVHPPGHPFWTETTLSRAAARYPGWNLTPYREAMGS